VAAKIFFRWAMKRHYIETNPAANVTAHASNRRKRILSAHELKTVWDATEDPMQSSQSITER
jgi:hypothetical protein